MSKRGQGLPRWIMCYVPSGPPVGYEYRVPEGHPCYGCRMYANPCVYPCNKFRKKKIDRTADEILLLGDCESHNQANFIAPKGK